MHADLRWFTWRVDVDHVMRTFFRGLLVDRLIAFQVEILRLIV